MWLVGEVDMTSPAIIDVAVITVVTELELLAASRLFKFDFDQPHEVDAWGPYWFLKIPARHYPRPLDVLVTCIGRDSNYRSGSFTSRLLATRRPRFLILCGIAAGLEGKVGLGDVVISEQVVGYDIGRSTPEGLEPRFDWKQPPAPVLNELRRLNVVIRPSWYDHFRSAQALLSSAELPPAGRTTDPDSHFGTIASGEKLLADGRLAELRKRYDEKIRAGEMEAIGLANAADPDKIPWVVVRGISDFGDPATKEHREKDRYHATAANSSAAYVRALLEHFSPHLFSDHQRLSSAFNLQVEALANRILHAARDGSTSLASVRRKLYELADEWESLVGPAPEDLLLIDRYELEMDYSSPHSTSNVLNLSMLSLSRSAATQFEEILTATRPASDDDLRLEVTPPLSVAVDPDMSSDRKKRVVIHFPRLRRGRRLSFGLNFQWCGTSTSTVQRWHEFVTDFLVTQLDLVIRTAHRIRILSLEEHTSSGEPRHLLQDEFTIVERPESMRITLLSPRFNRKYRIGFELLTE